MIDVVHGNLHCNKLFKAVGQGGVIKSLTSITKQKEFIRRILKVTKKKLLILIRQTTLVTKTLEVKRKQIPDKITKTFALR